MRKLIVAGAVAALLMGAAPALSQETLREGGATGGDLVVGYSAEDQAMNQAVAEARRTLPAFWSAQRMGGGERFQLKAEFSGPNSTEHMWVSDVERRDGRLTGILQNEPYDIPTMHKGDRVTFDESQVSDWSYIKDGQMWGAYTTRVMVEQMPPEEAKEWREFLSPNPVEGRTA